MNYTNILSRAWKLTWRHKVLWIFGILAGCGQGGGGGGNGQANFRTDFPGGRPADFPFLRQIERFFDRPESLPIIIGVVIVLLLVGLVVFVLSIIGRGGLIGGAALAEEKGAVTFGEAWAIGVKSFWRLFLLGLLIALPVIIVALIVAGGVALTAGFALPCLLPLLCVVIVAIIPLAVWAHFAQFGVVLDGLGVRAALANSWQVIKANLGPIVLLGLILLGVGIIAGLALAAPLLLLVVPVMIGFALGQNNGPPTGLLIAAGIGFLCYLPILIALQGILQTWVMSAWTLAYRQFTARGQSSTASLTPDPSPSA